MTIIELRSAYPHLFYYHQDWFAGESFTRILPNDRYRTAPHVTRRGLVPKDGGRLPLAVDLANAYIATPNDPVWQDYLWCRDTDHLGQRIFVGGTANGHGFEFHRHIHVSDRFGMPAW